MITASLLLFSKVNFGQAPALGTAADYALFSTIGAVSNSGINYLTHVTGNVGTNSDPTIPGFGNVDGVMTYVSDPRSAQCAADLTLAYNQLNAAIPAFFPGPLLGNGQTLNAGIYSITNATISLNLDLTLDGQGDPNALFIFQLQGAFATSVNAKVKLINGALACNVFWKVEGQVDMAAGTSMKGTVIANNAAINMNVNDTLEGRALSTNGAVSVSAILVYTPIGCGSPVLTGPIAPNLASAACYSLFAGIGDVANAGITNAIGDIGSNGGLTTGYDPLLVIGTIHPVPDASTAQCGADVNNVYAYLNGLSPGDIELLRPDLFGHNLVLTPHTYLMLSAVTFTDTVFLNAEGNANAVFVINVNGAFSTSTYSKVILINGTQAKNVFWKIDGAVTINDYSIFNGTIIGAGAIDLNIGVQINGRALTSVGALNTAAVTVIIPPGTCGSISSPVVITEPINQTVCLGDSVSFWVSATGMNLTYQWRKGNVNLIDGGNISGATTDTLTINPVTLADTAYNYNVIVTGSLSPNDTSINVSLTVGTPPVITMEPVSQTACAGDSVSFSVTASGTGLTYQWRKGNTNLLNSGNISGANTSVLKINPASITDTAFNYNVIVSSLCGSDTSLNAALIINAKPIALPSSNSPVCAGDTIKLMADTIATATYDWSGPNSYASIMQNPFILNAAIADAGTYSLVVTLNGCSSDTANVIVAVNTCAVDLSVVKTVNNTAPIFGHTIVFTITASNNGPLNATGVEVNDILQSGYVYVTSTATAGSYNPATGIWTIGGLANGASAVLTITVNVISGGNYVNTAIIYGSQSDPDMTNNNSSVETFPTDFNIPEGFSPNGDGTNDLFVIRGINYYPENTFVIFNRWGDKVFEASPYQNTWDGKCKTGLRIGGDDLPIGTYFYLLDLGDGSEVIKGTIYLNK